MVPIGYGGGIDSYSDTNIHIYNITVKLGYSLFSAGLDF